MGQLFNSEIFKFIFFSLALGGVINGQNIIDGTNGLSAFTGISIFSCILYLGFYLNDNDLITVSLIVISILFCFLLFNFPFGKIFLGDCGSYLIGLLSGYLIIKTFGKYDELPSWSAVIILYYPTMETIFSFCRKIYNKKSPFKPDNKHLHIIIFLLISKNYQNPNLFNSLVAPFLSIMWLSPLAVLPISLEIPMLSFLILATLSITYIFFYMAIPKPKDISS
jgi:UDP-N-acetylmuramyl pentapeptide phosphotransferase/UDP-N-acetylglucosamine-1-phosphate transferase